MVEDKGGLGLAALQQQSDRFIRRLEEQSDVVGVSTQFRSNAPQLYMDIDRDKLASLGVSFDEAFRRYRDLPRLFVRQQFQRVREGLAGGRPGRRRYRARPESLHLFRLRNNNGQMVPLGTVVDVREIGGPVFVTRYNLAAAAPITGTLAPGASSGEVIAATDSLARQTLPRSMRTQWTELMFLEIKEGSTAGVVFALAVMCVFLALAALYESWTLPLAVILVVPMCVLSSLAGVLWTGKAVNVFVQIGLVVLVGLACKNAILIVEFARHLHEEGRSVDESCAGSVSAAFATDLDDVVRVHPWRPAAGSGIGRRGGDAPVPGHRGVQRHAGRDLLRHLPDAAVLLHDPRVRRGPAVRRPRGAWIGSGLLGGLIGGAGGWLVSRLGVCSSVWGLLMGVCGGALAPLAVLGIHRTIRSRGVTRS